VLQVRLTGGCRSRERRTAGRLYRGPAADRASCRVAVVEAATVRTLFLVVVLLPARRLGLVTAPGEELVKHVVAARCGRHTWYAITHQHIGLPVPSNIAAHSATHGTGGECASRASPRQPTHFFFPRVPSLASLAAGTALCSRARGGCFATADRPSLRPRRPRPGRDRHATGRARTVDGKALYPPGKEWDMTVVSVSMPDELLERIDSFADEHGYTGRSEVVREAARPEPPELLLCGARRPWHAATSGPAPPARRPRRGPARGSPPTPSRTRVRSGGPCAARR
jgi:hypothetical protein